MRSLVRLLQDDFYADEQMAINAVNRQGSFNIIHFETMHKVDFFVLGSSAFDDAQLSRATMQSFDGEEMSVISAEDTILAKLRWYRMGGETSERQWSDVTSIVKVQGNRLELDYMREMAVSIGVSDLLNRLLNQAL